jgi:hypothetical protein
VKGAKLRAHLEDLGYLVLVGGPRCYDLCDEDAAFRFGWVQNTTGDGRTDCNSWIEFTTELMERES